MDWKACAVDDLRRYPQMKIGVLNSREKLRTVESLARSAKTSLKRNPGHTDSRLVDAIVESERLRKSLKQTEALIRLIERGLESLTEEERLLLTRFYMSRTTPNITDIKRELGYETRSIYRLRDRALVNFTLAMYGIEVS